MSSNSQFENSRQPSFKGWVNIPFPPKKYPFFYGWVIVVVSTLSIICSIPGQTAGIGLFTDDLIKTLGISRNQLSIAYMAGTIISGLILPFAGKLLDTIGVRFMSLFASLGLAISLLIMSNVNWFNTKLSILIPSGLRPIFIASFTFLLVRFFGQGNMTMVGRVAMARWFNHRRGIATAISGVPVAFAFSATPWILNQAITAFGWRQACWLMALIVGGAMALVGILFFRDTPEACGLVMDGLSSEEFLKKKKIKTHTIYHEFTRNEAIKTLSFWSFALGLAVHGLIITAIAFHITSIGEEMGKTREQAVLMFFFSSFISIPMWFIVSYFIDNTSLRLKWVLMALSLATFSYTFSLMFFNNPVGWWATIISFGMSSGIWGILCNVAFPRYFGRKHLGAISGLNMSIMVIASAIGPIFFSSIRQILGSYRQACLLTLVLPMVVFVLSLVTKNPQRKYESRNLSDNFQ